MTEGQAETGDAAGRREFEADGVAWTAEITGRGAAGGPSATGVIESVHFRAPGTSEPAVRLAYLPAGRFADLTDDELRDLLRSAPPLARRSASAGAEERERAADRDDGAIEDYTGGADG